MCKSIIGDLSKYSTLYFICWQRPQQKGKHVDQIGLFENIDIELCNCANIMF